MSDPRTYQRTGAYCSWETMEQQDAESEEISEGELAERDDYEALADYVK